MRIKGMEVRVGLDRDVAAGARQDFDAFFRDHFERVARSAALVTREPSTGPDLAQEAFARLFSRWESIESDDHARNFAYKVAINLARSHLRKHLPLLYGLQRTEAAVSGDATARTDDWLLVADALDALSARQRVCVVLVDYADLDSVAAAAVLGMSASTVRVHLARGRQTLRSRLGMMPKDGTHDE